MSRPPHYAYYVPAAHIEVDRIREILHGLGLDQAWVRLVPTEARFEEHELLQLEVYDLTSGAPIFAEEIGPALAHDAGLAVIIGLDEEDNEAALLVSTADEEIIHWAGQFDEFEATDDEENEHTGKEGYLTVFEHIVGHPLSDFIDAESISVTAADVADGDTDLLLRGRFMGLPKNLPRVPEIFGFHEEDDEDEEDEDRNDDDGDRDDNKAEEETDRVALVLVDLRLTEFLWRESPAQEVGQFLAAIEPHKGHVLGPLADGLGDANTWIAQQPPTRPLAQSKHPDLVTYEVLVMASALGYAAGTSVHRLDERLLPLLHLREGAISVELLKDSLDDIDDLGVLSAMAEVLPYTVPEGELLECFDDDELSPLAAWAVHGDAYEGALLRLDAKRLIEDLATFDPEPLKKRAERFLRAWFEADPKSTTSFETWRATRTQDDDEWTRFETQLDELRLVLSLLQTNALEPALVFYGD
ncbi:MAG: hypothetical protein KAI47_15270 [Deltaproteobacteria bacterium]|nr:hypothetical protein [Deltaproteobacteria bacterium]